MIIPFADTLTSKPGNLVVVCRKCTRTATFKADRQDEAQLEALKARWRVSAYGTYTCPRCLRVAPVFTGQIQNCKRYDYVRSLPSVWIQARFPGEGIER